MEFQPGPDHLATTLSQTQIELLQLLIRQFKALNGRFSNSALPQLIDELMNQQGDASKAQDSLLFAQTSQSLQPRPSESDRPAWESSAPPLQQPSLTWQCFHSLLAVGLSKTAMDSFISCAPSDLGCFSKGAFLPLVQTIPSVCTVREMMLKAQTNNFTNLSIHSTIELQRTMRSSFLKNWVDQNKKHQNNPLLSSDVALTECKNAALYNRSNRRASIKNDRRWEKEERRKRDVMDRKKRILNDFQRTLLEHRDNFLKFHKSVRTEAGKISKNMKMAVEALDAKKSKDEARAEWRRLQALKENDMEAYATMVQEAKNGRLKFLLSETDKYIEAINKLVQENRDDSQGSTQTKDHSLQCLEDSKGSAAAKDYFRSAHRNVETVMQPLMLKGGDLKEYQMAGLEWMVSLYNNNLNGILADEMGLGKTIQTIALLSYLMEIKRNNGPFLVVVPLSTMSNWVNEFNKWAPDIIKVVYKGTPDERKRIYKEEIEGRGMNVLITTYEYIMKDKTTLKKIYWQYVVVDEGHRMKNAESKFAQTLGNVYQSKHRLLLTGTPLQNNLPELWALLNFLLPSIFSSLETFDQWFNKPFFAFRNQNSEESGFDESNNMLTQEERLLVIYRLHEVLRPFVLRRVKDQVLDQLPEKIERVLRCSLSGWQRQMYSLVTNRALNGNNSIVGGGLNNTIMQLRKICNHPYLFLAEYLVDDDIVRMSGKFELLDRMLPKLKAAGHRVLMFSQMVEVMNVLERYFNLRGFAFQRLDGSTAADEREKRMFAFNDPNSPYFIFLLSTRAGGLGLNLATADTVIIFDSDWNPMADAQAQDRAHRIGQKNEVRVFRLITNTPVEERIISRANDKKNLTGLVVEAGKFNARQEETAEESNKEFMESLLKEWITNGSQATGSSELADDDDVPDDDQINEMMATCDGELELYRSIDQANPCNPGVLSISESPQWLTSESCLPKCSWLFFPQLKDDYSSNADGFTVEGPSSKQLRKKKEVCYDDGLTDVQFMKRLDMEQDSPESSLPPSKKRATSDPAVSELLSCLDQLNREKFAALFRDKPSKQRYRDYYDIIKSPISLKEISRKLKGGQYFYFEEIESDFALMSHNARVYNGDQSPVFFMAEEVRTEFYNLVKPRLDESFPFISSLEPPSLPSDSSEIRNHHSIKLSELFGDDRRNQKRMKF